MSRHVSYLPVCVSFRTVAGSFVAKWRPHASPCLRAGGLIRISLGAALVTSVVVPARAEPRGEAPVTLAWNAPKECPSGVDVSARAAARLPPDAHVVAKGRVERTGGRYRLVLEIESKGERTLEAATCDALASSAAVVLAMSVAPPEETPKRAAEPEAAPPLPPMATTTREPERVRPEAATD